MKIKPAANLKIKSIKRIKGSHLSGGLKNKLFIRTFIGLLFLLLTGFMTKEIFQKLCHSDFFQITTMKIDGN